MENTFITDDQPIIPAATESLVEAAAEPVIEAAPADEKMEVNEINETPVLTDVVQQQAVHVIEQRSFARRSANQPIVVTQVTGE